MQYSLGEEHLLDELCGVISGMRYLRNQLGMYMDPSRKELAVDLLLEARSLWIWSNRVGSERKDPRVWLEKAGRI